eukprot:Plantae.Rhodophyta-Purpureofilum_apyrenoidigerum.ctg21185.p1 GENE.Plantae.Rhodophyta-Purpureofilum_apyrenoidigerum.ctg21185~~Plantae.Rhodophyta-Purpureofilum_apyrenoidigerum.ctg21185.p1  ORF type:complete len:492 (+),score=126.03 Plantae.Rhodophyta-Purpureofilum_apyrenoidigerum.ctg21185:296-1771(+)
MTLIACANICEEDEADGLDDVSFKPREQRLKEMRQRKKQTKDVKRRPPSVNGMSDKENAEDDCMIESTYLQASNVVQQSPDISFGQNGNSSHAMHDSDGEVSIDRDECMSIEKNNDVREERVKSKCSSENENSEASVTQHEEEAQVSPHGEFAVEEVEKKLSGFPNLLLSSETQCAEKEDDRSIFESRNAESASPNFLNYAAEEKCGLRYTSDSEAQMVCTEEQPKEVREDAVAQANKRANQLESRIQVLEKTLEAERAEMKRLREQFSATFEKMTANSSDDGSEETKRLRAENSRLRADLKGGTEAFNGLKERYSKFKEAVVKYDAHEKELIAQIRTLRKSLVDLETWNKEFKLHAEQKLQDAFEQVCSHRSQLKLKNSECESAAAATRRLESKLRAADEEVARLERKIDERSSTDFEHAERRAQEAQIALSRVADENNGLKVRLFDSIQAVDALKAEKARLQAQYSEVNKENLDLKQLCEELLAKLETH